MVSRCASTCQEVWTQCLADHRRLIALTAELQLAKQRSVSEADRATLTSAERCMHAASMSVCNCGTVAYNAMEAARAATTVASATAAARAGATRVQAQTSVRIIAAPCHGVRIIAAPCHPGYGGTGSARSVTFAEPPATVCAGP